MIRMDLTGIVLGGIDAISVKKCHSSFRKEFKHIDHNSQNLYPWILA
jgi:hypothetical protein